jgi:hypothetical protein
MTWSQTARKLLAEILKDDSTSIEVSTHEGKLIIKFSDPADREKFFAAMKTSVDAGMKALAGETEHAGVSALAGVKVKR